MATYNWEELQTEYVTTNTSYRKMAAKYGMHPNTIFNMAKKQGWTDARKQYREKIVTKATDSCATKDAQKLVRLQLAADGLASAIDVALQDKQQLQRHLVHEGNGSERKLVERELQKIDARAARDLAAALKDLTATMRNLYGLPSKQEQDELEIKRQRLELEKQRQFQLPEDIDTGVVVMAEVLCDD